MLKKLAILFECRLLDLHIPSREITTGQLLLYSKCARCNQEIIKDWYDDNWRLQKNEL